MPLERCCEQAYYCPTSGESECAVHGGFDVCCDRPELHEPLVVDESPRFVVGSVTGVRIDPNANGGKGNGQLPTSYYVHDRAYCYRVVAAYEAPAGSEKGSRSDRTRLLFAQLKCDELNRWDREQSDDPRSDYPERGQEWA